MRSSAWCRRTRSARFPISTVPRSGSPRTAAAFTVQAAIASCGVSPQPRTARAMANGIECVGAEPELKLVASATAPPWSTRKPARAKRPPVWKPVQGRMTPHAWDPARASAPAGMEARAGQDDAACLGSGQGDEVGLGRGLEVVDAARMEPDRLRDHAEGAELVGVDAERRVPRRLFDEPHAGLPRPGALLNAGIHGCAWELA